MKLKRIQWVGAVLVAALVLGLAAPQLAQAQSSKEKIRLLSSALRAHDAGDLEAARTNLQSLLSIAPNDSNVRRLLAAVQADIAARRAQGLGLGPLEILTPTVGTPQVQAPAVNVPSAQLEPITPAPVQSVRPVLPVIEALQNFPAAPAAPSNALPVTGPLTGFEGVLESEDEALRAQKRALMADAVALRNAGDLQGAAARLRQILALDPNDAPASLMLQSIEAQLARANAGSAQPAQPFAPAPLSQVQPQAQAADFLAREAARQSGTVEAARAGIREAKDLARSGNYAGALASLDAIEGTLPVNTATLPVLRELYEARAEIALDQAEVTRTNADYFTAGKAIDGYGERFGADSTYNRLRARYERLHGDPAFRSMADIDPSWDAQQANISQLIMRGRTQFYNGDYAGAQRTFSEVEKLDPGNVEVKSLQTSLAQMRGEDGEWDRVKTRTQLLEEVNRGWQRPKVYQTGGSDMQDAFMPNPVLAKLKTIRLPRVSFAGAKLSSAIETLSELSVRFDADKSEGGGVNILLMDPAKEDPEVTLTLRNVTLERALDFITQAAGFKYAVESGAVVVSKGGESKALETRFFPLSRATVIRLTGFKNAHRESASSDPFASSATQSNAPTSLEEEDALRSFFGRAGVPFEGTAGSSLAFDGTQIIVTQTPRNLERLANILRRYNETEQVEIEAKFLEVQQGALEELGFDWAFRDGNDSFQTVNTNSDFGVTGDNLRNLNQAFNNTSAGNTGSITQNGINSLIAAAIPSFPNIINVGSGGAASGSFGAAIGSWQANFILRALEQQTGSDLLTAPRITVLAGKSAEIVVAQKLLYPTSYGDMDAEVSDSEGGGGGSVAITPGTPQDFREERVGVTLMVTPEVEEDDSITLKLNPRVTEFEGFVEYGGRAIGIANNTTVNVPTGFYQPVFSVREISTEVTLFDGATVMLGGLTREEVKTVEDKVPVLGDIPLMGRLFRSEGETKQKRNLLIFVTASLVSPGGSPANPSVSEVEPGALYQNPVVLTPEGAINR